MPNREEDELWLGRLEATGQAQARYLWLLLVAGLFYGALARGVGAGAITVPVVDLTLDTALVLASGGPIIAFLVLAVMGAIRAWTHALEQYRGESPASDSEQLDTQPNALDLAMYTTEASPKIVRRVLSFVYPLYLTVALAESFWLARGTWRNPYSFGRWYVGAAWFVLWAPACILVLGMWWSRARPPKSP